MWQMPLPSGYSYPAPANGGSFIIGNLVPVAFALSGAPGTLNISANGQFGGNGGTIKIFATSTGLTGDLLALSANGSNGASANVYSYPYAGSGGTITFAGQGVGNNIAVANTAGTSGAVSISATGGDLGSSSAPWSGALAGGSGGTVT